MRKTLLERIKKSILYVLVVLMVAGCLPAAAPRQVQASTLISKVSVTLERISARKKNDLLYSQ